MSIEKEISTAMISWYRANARQLPWRETKDPYKIWLSEIILQQTSVQQGLPYYLRFVERYPRLDLLAKASPDEVLKLWQGLGYYSRARNLHEAAKYIHEVLGGQFPQSYSELIKLKGVGKYTAAAIASFSFDEACVVVDGNVKRFISRLYGIMDSIDSSKTENTIRDHAQCLLNHQKPDEFNQTIMEIGAMVCTKNNPSCQSCPVSGVCVASAKNLQGEIPHRTKKTKKRDRYFYYALVVDKKDRLLIRQRNAKDIWKGLYEFPLIEAPSHKSAFPNLEEFGFNYTVKDQQLSIVYKHLLSHQNIYAQFCKFTLDEDIAPNSHREYIKISTEAFKNYPVARLIDLYLADLSITLF